MIPALGEVWQLDVLNIVSVVVLVVEHEVGTHGSDSTPEHFIRCLIVTSDWEEKWTPGTLCNWHPGHFNPPGVRLA